MLRVGLFLMLMVGSATRVRAEDSLRLPMIKPVVSCERLVTASLEQAVGTAVVIKSASELDTAEGKFCKVIGTIAPAITMEVDLPLERWTQRYLEVGCGGLCGTLRTTIPVAGSCTPALNGEFVVAGNDMGHSGGGASGSFGSDPDARVDWAYRANHETTLAAKALIRTFYGQPQKYSYFVGCSDCGREALVEAQRYPKDFVSIHNSFFHGWEGAINKR